MNAFFSIAVEFIGTFIFLMVIGVMASMGTRSIAPLAMGLALAVVIYAFGSISGGHFNPAVTLGASASSGWQNKYIGYIIAQIIAGVLAFLFAKYSEANLTQ